MRHTKIIATLGPATNDDATLDALLRAGVDVVRLNFSHGTHETQTRTYERARAAAARLGRHVAVLQDLSGPKIRTGRLAGGQPLALREGDLLVIATGDFVADSGGVLVSSGGTTSKLVLGMPYEETDERGVVGVETLRGELVPAALGGLDVEHAVGGGSAEAVDFADNQSGRLALVIGFVLLLTMLIMVLTFRSVAPGELAP